MLAERVKLVQSDVLDQKVETANSCVKLVQNSRSARSRGLAQTRTASEFCVNNDRLFTSQFNCRDRL
jgi:hypothetical protein